MFAGQLVKLLLHTGVTRYLEFKSIEGSYVYKKGGKIHKVPANEREALGTSTFSHRLFSYLLSVFFPTHPGFVTTVTNGVTYYVYVYLSGLLGLFEKRRFKKLLTFIYEYDENNTATWKGFDASTKTAQELFTEHNLDSNVSDFTGHALALFLNDE